MKGVKTTHRICSWILLVLVFAEFVFIAYNWLAYCPPIAAAKFVFSGAWFKEGFHIGSAGLALDQPTIGKFFLWTSVMSCLACTIVLLLRVVVDADRQAARRWVNVGTTVLLALVLIELLAPTFILMQYVISMGMTIRRVLGLCLCCGFWVLLPSVVFWTWRAASTRTPWVRSPPFWALVCSLVAPTYYLCFILHPSTWRHWDTITTVFVLAWVVLVVQGLSGMWMMARQRVESVDNSKTPNGLNPTVDPRRVNVGLGPTFGEKEKKIVDGIPYLEYVFPYENNTQYQRRNDA